MAGEYTVARACVASALESANADPAMNADVMADALLVTLISHMLTRRSRKDLTNFVQYQLESCGEDEFVITRGC